MKQIHKLAIGAALLMTGAVSAVTFIVVQQPAEAARVTVAIPPAKASALIEATSGAGAAEMQAVGEQAKVINAALPFSGAPLYAARPFDDNGTTLDQQRALLCLTQAVYYEAAFEPLEGRRAVAQVVLNRLRHPAFPKSVCGVVYQGAGTRVCQFTFVCDGALYRRPAQDAWRQAEAIARAALTGYVEKSVGEATHYHADYVAPRWAPLLAKVARIGQHIFYRWPGAWGQPQAFVGRYVGEPRDPLSMRPPMPTDQPTLASEAVVAEAGPITDGTVLQHAPEDVGGLLDTTKGWTLNIPAPGDVSAASKMIAAQEHKPAPTAELASAAAAAAAPASASR